MASLASSESLIPQSCELDRVFQDFRQNAARQSLPNSLQRANHQFTRQKSIELQQKKQLEAELVFNLLPSGHNTNLSVDYWRVVLEAEGSIALRIPVTLVSHKGRVALLRTSSSGEVRVRWYPDIESAFPVLEAAVEREPRTHFPRYLHKPHLAPATLHSSRDSALAAWTMAVDLPQRLQQFVQPLTKSRTVTRVHWKDGERQTSFYCLATGPSKQHLTQGILTKIPVLSRSCSEASIPAPSIAQSPSLVVQRVLSIPDIEKSLPGCVKLLSASLNPRQKVTEAVFDFAADYQRSWVFLSCKGYTFASHRKILTQTVEQQERVDINFLMYPVIARRGAVKKKINRPKHLGVLNYKGRMAFAEAKPIGTSDLISNTVPCLPSSPMLELPPRPPRPESVLLSREISQYETLVHGSRLHRERTKNSVDLVDKYGGASAWRPLLIPVFMHFSDLREMQKYFEEMIPIEQQHMFISALLRVFRGDFNFYYKEALRRIHAKHAICREDFRAFTAEVERALQAAGVLSSDCLVRVGNA